MAPVTVPALLWCTDSSSSKRSMCFCFEWQPIFAHSQQACEPATMDDLVRYIQIVVLLRVSRHHETQRPHSHRYTAVWPTAWAWGPASLTGKHLTELFQPFIETTKCFLNIGTVVLNNVWKVPKVWVSIWLILKTLWESRVNKKQIFADVS